MLANFGGELGDAPAKQVCYLQRSRELLWLYTTVCAAVALGVQRCSKPFSSLRYAHIFTYIKDRRVRGIQGLEAGEEVAQRIAYRLEDLMPNRWCSLRSK